MKNSSKGLLFVALLFTLPCFATNSVNSETQATSWVFSSFNPVHKEVHCPKHFMKVCLLGVGCACIPDPFGK